MHSWISIIDIFLMIFPIAAYLARPRVGGEMERGVRLLLAGVFVMGLAHFLETGLFLLTGIDVEANELFHRVIVVLGFILIVWGFFRMRQAFED